VNVPRIIGIALVVLGVFVLWKRPTYTTRHDVVEIGEFRASVDEREPIPPWWGVAGVGGGVALLLVGARLRGSKPRE
jgi:hypothetical protein